jgi:hypothetical protein
MTRERLRSRFHVVSLVCVLTLVAGCTGPFGAGFAELPASQGWQPLPIGDWVLNEGIEARTMVFCPRENCPQQGFASVLAFSGREARQMEQALKADPERLAGIFSKRPETTGKQETKKTAPGTASTKPKSTTRVSRFEAEGTSGLLVEIRARGDSVKSATTAILHGREGDRLMLAIAVSPDAESARRDAIAAWRSR